MLAGAGQLFAAYFIPSQFPDLLLHESPVPDDVHRNVRLLADFCPSAQCMSGPTSPYRLIVTFQVDDGWKSTMHAFSISPTCAHVTTTDVELVGPAATPRGNAAHSRDPVETGERGHSGSCRSFPAMNANNRLPLSATGDTGYRHILRNEVRF